MPTETAADADYAIRLSGVVKRFGPDVAVNGIDLTIRRNEFFSILGPSGCGKTTLLRMIAGFELPTSGEVWLDGENVAQKPPHKRNLNMLFQSYALFPHLTVGDNVAFELRVRRFPRQSRAQEVAAALRLVRLEGLEDRRPNQLSGGQRQRVALARAIVSRPAVVLLDEPLGALDRKLRQDMQIELKRLQREVGITFIYVTHDQEEALTMSDRMAVMSSGTVLQVGTPMEVYQRPATTFVADFIGGANLLTGKVSSQPHGGLVLAVPGLAPLPVEPVDGLADGAEARLAIRSEHIRIAPAGGAPPAAHRQAWLTGVVQDVVFLGGETLYRVGLANDDRLNVRVGNSGSRAVSVIPAGTEVVVSWDCADARLLTA